MAKVLPVVLELRRRVDRLKRESGILLGTDLVWTGASLGPGDEDSEESQVALALARGDRARQKRIDRELALCMRYAELRGICKKCLGTGEEKFHLPNGDSRHARCSDGCPFEVIKKS